MINEEQLSESLEFIGEKLSDIAISLRKLSNRSIEEESEEDEKSDEEQEE